MADIDFKNGVNVDSAYVDGHKVQLIAVPDGSLELPISATSDSGYIVDGNGKKHRVLLATFLTGTQDYKLSSTADSAYMTVDGQKVKVRLAAKLTNSVELPSSANADQGYALGDDSKKHRVTLVATPTGTLELPNSETDDSAYVVDGNGKKHKVRLFFLAAGGGEEVIVKGVSPLSLPDAIANSLQYVKAFGGTEQNGTPTPDAPVDIVSNNGALKLGYTSRNLNVGTLDNQGYTSTGGTSTSTTFCGTLWKIKVQEGEKYTVSYGNFPDGVSGVFINTWKTDGTWNLRQAISISGDYTYTIPAGVGEVNFTLYKTGGITIGSNSWLQVEKGETATPYVPAGYGLYVDGTTETINVHGSNIFDKNDTENIGSWYSGSNQTITQAAANATLVMRAKPNTTYYFKHCSVKGGCRAFYTEVEDWEIGSACSAMSGNAGANANVVYSITTSANAKWIFFNYGRNNLEASLDDQRNDFMVSTSGLTSDTPYEQYFNGGSATAEMLLKVGNYQDEQEILSGAVTRKVGVKVLDGTENVGTSNATFTIAISDRVSSKTPLVCSHFQYSNKTSSQTEDLTIISFSSTNIGFRYDACADTTAFKTWLADQYAAGTPVIVVYQLATETTESVAGQTLQVQDGDNVLEITQASLTGLELETQYTKTA